MLRVLTLKCTPQRTGLLVSSGDLETPGPSTFESSEIANLFHKGLELRFMSSRRERKGSDKNFALGSSIQLCRRDIRRYFSFKELGANFLGSDSTVQRTLYKQSSEKQNGIETSVPVKKTILA